MSVRHPKLSQSVRDSLGRVGHKWAVMVVGLLSPGPMRFSELERKVDGISVVGEQRSSYGTRSITCSYGKRSVMES